MTSPRPPYGKPTMPLPGQALRLGHLVPERRQIVVSRPNPEWTSLAPDDPRRDELPEMQDVVLQGYVFGPRCPGVVKAELASIEEAYLTSLAEASAVQEASGGSAPSASGTAVFVTAWHTFLRETIMALVPGLTPGEADVLASVPPGQEGEGTQILRYLSVWAPDAPEGGDPGDPEAGGGETASTTAPSSPTSSASTASDPPTS